jgi:hypothetical protein
MQWIYTDYRSGKNETIFECDAPDVLAADGLFEAATGLIARKETWITVKSPDWSKSLG